LGPFVEIVAAVGDIDAARAAHAELEALAARFGQPYLDAVTAHAQGTVLLSEGNASAALAALRRAWTTWRSLEAPYEAARVRVEIARACQGLGDNDRAEMELDAARATFASLRAAPDIAHVDRLAGKAPGDTTGLTPREREVLVLIARGNSNRQIADELVISEKTVASHLTHIFTKLGLTSRTAATAYAYDHGLVWPGAPSAPSFEPFE
jgi:DNA-binding NarL/FixJ family response regulator